VCVTELYNLKSNRPAVIPAVAKAVLMRALNASNRSAHMTLISSLFKEKLTSPLSLMFSTVMEDSGSWDRSFLILSQPRISLRAMSKEE
jgi:hypothetical protein